MKRLTDWWMWAAFLLLVALLALIGGPDTAQAGQATVSWTNPSANTDGSPLPASQITGSVVEWGTCSGAAFGAPAGETTTAGAATSVVIESLAPGAYCFRVATRANGLQSEWSAVAAKAVPFPAPNPPTIVTVESVALERTWWGYRYAGTVALGVPCGKRAPGDAWADLAEIPRSAVTLARRARGKLYGVCA